LVFWFAGNEQNCQIVSESLFTVNLHKMHSIMADLRQNETGIEQLGTLPKELPSSGLLSTHPKKNHPVCPLVYTKLDREILPAFLNFFEIY